MGEGKKTEKGWTPDDFLSRFTRYVDFITRLDLEEAPNPSLWLEGGWGDEVRRQGGLVVRKEVDGVVTWEMLEGLEWDGDEMYPRAWKEVYLPFFS